ncbi:unnamed protein product [Ascophyllum nodosum]
MAAAAVKEKEGERELVVEAFRARDEALEGLAAAHVELNALKKRQAGMEEGLVVARREGEILVERAGGLEAELDEALEGLAAAHVELNALKERQAGMEEGLVVARREGEILVGRAGGLEAELDEALEGLEEGWWWAAAHVELNAPEGAAGGDGGRAGRYYCLPTRRTRRTQEEAEANRAAAEESGAVRQELEAERSALSVRLSEAEGAKSKAEDEAGALRERVGALERQLEELQNQLENATADLGARDSEGSARDGETVQAASERAAESEEPADGERSSKEVALLARCQELEQEAAAATQKIALLEKVVTEGAAGQAAAGESEEGELGSRSKAPVPEPEEAGKASSSPPGTGDEESQARELLEDRLRIWEAEVKESKQTAAEMEGVIAGLRKGEAALEGRLLELTTNVSAAKEAASVAQEKLETAKEENRKLSERASGAEALVQELQKKRDAATKATDDAEEVFRGEKSTLEARVLELTDEVSTAKKAASIAQEGLEAAKEEARPLRERAFAAEALLQELQEKREAATRTADDAEEVLRKEKVVLETQLEEVAQEVDRSRKVLLKSSSAATAATEAIQAEKAKAEEESSNLREQVAAQKEKISKAVAHMRSLKADKEAATEELASRATLLEDSLKNLEDANAHSRALEEALTEERAAAAAAREAAAAKDADGGERLSALEAELLGLRQKMASTTRNMAEAEDRARDFSEEATRLRGQLENRSTRLEELQEAFRQSAARIPTLEGDLEAERVGRRELEGEVRALREDAKATEKIKEAFASENEEIMSAMQGQVDSANKERDAAQAGLEAARQAKEVIEAKLKEAAAEAESLHAKLEAFEEDNRKLRAEAAKVVGLEEKGAQLSAKVQESEAKLEEALATLQQREDDLARTVAEKEEAAEGDKTAKEDLETKVKRLKTLLSKLQKSNQSKDADIAALKTPPPPKVFTIDLRVRYCGSVWCLLRTDPSGPAGTKAAATAGPEEGGAANRDVLTAEGLLKQKQWVNEDKLRAWMAGGTSRSDDSLWPTVVQDDLEKKAAAAKEEASAAEARAASKQAELETLSSDFAKYKARAHTALKKATSSGADDKRKDEVIADLESDRDRMAEELGQTRAEFEKQIAEATSAAKLAQDDLQMMSEQLDAAQEQVRDLQGSLRDYERKVSQLQEVEDGHSEELSILRETIDELKSQLKAARAQATESSCITQRLQDELERIAKEREASDGRRGSWDPRSDGGWAGQQILDSRRGMGVEPSRGFPNQPRLLEDAVSPPTPGSVAAISASASDVGVDELIGEASISVPAVAAQPVHLMAVAELERRNMSVESKKQAEVSEMRTELAEALLRVEQLSEQEAVLKATVRALEVELKTERDLGSSESGSVNVAYLKSAVVRYMSTRDTGEQRSLLRVISTILQLTRLEVEAVEARIAELERTMMGRAGNMVGGAGRRVGGVVGGVVGFVWRGGGKGGPGTEAGTGATEEVENGRDEVEGEGEG